MASEKNPKHILPIIFCLAPIILLAFGFFSFENHQSFVASPLQKSRSTGGWILEHVGMMILFFTTQAAEPEAVHIRNRLGKSIFVTNTEGGQGAFQRAYALEWEHRRDIQSDFNQSWEELKNRYHITFVLAKVGEEVSEGEEVFSDGEYVVYRIGNNEEYSLFLEIPGQRPERRKKKNNCHTGLDSVSQRKRNNK